MQRTYFQGLKLKPSYDQIVGYLENDQQFMAHPDRTYTRLKNDQYYSNLNMAGINSLNAQSDNLLKEQAKQLNRTQQMQTLGLSQPQVAAASIASGSGAFSPIQRYSFTSAPGDPMFDIDALENEENDRQKEEDSRALERFLAQKALADFRKKEGFADKVPDLAFDPDQPKRPIDPDQPKKTQRGRPKKEI